jgi:hypothetical protein
VFRWQSVRVMIRILPHTKRAIGFGLLRRRRVGLSFLIPGVASPLAFGGLDLVAAILEVAAISGLVARASWAIPALWVFNVSGALDLLHAIYQGQFGVRIGPGSLGAAFFIPTIVTLLYSCYTA